MNEHSIMDEALYGLSGAIKEFVKEMGYFGNPEEGERPPLEAATKRRLVRTEEALRVL
jgi:hypothetical protein